MTTWVYYAPDGWSGPKEKSAAVLGIPVETLGRTQAQLLLRARKSQGGLLVLAHDRASNRDRMAARRLVERELLAGPNWSGAVKNWRGRTLARNVTGLYVYTLTGRGRSCWLRVKEER